MALDSAIKKQIMTEYATVENDTGSPEVQVAMLTRRISDLTGWDPLVPRDAFVLHCALVAGRLADSCAPIDTSAPAVGPVL